MTNNPLFIDQGDHVLLSPAGTLLVAMDAAYGPAGYMPNTEGSANARKLIAAILAAARAGGYKQADILETMLHRNEVTDRLKVMAREACSAAGNEAMRRVFSEIGL